MLAFFRNISSLNFKMYVPRNQIGKQDVKVSSLSLKPNKFYTTDNGALKMSAYV